MANKNIIIFLLFTVSISVVLNYFIITSEAENPIGDLLILLMMWIPGVSAILTVIVNRQSLKMIKWRIGKPKYLFSAYFIPLIYTSFAYLPLWILGFFNSEKELTIYSFFLPILGVFVNIIATLGEEIGWRGFLFFQLEKKYSFTKASLITGFIWSIWHIPGLLFTEYGNNAPWLTAIPFFIITLTAISYPMAYLCKKANSIWPAVLFHAAHNAFIQAFYDPFSLNNNSSKFLLGETGLALAATSVVLLIIFMQRRYFVLPARIKENESNK